MSGFLTGFLVALAVIAGLYLTDANLRFGSWAFIWVPLCALFAGWLIFGVLLPMRRQGDMQNSHQLSGALTVRLLPEGIRTESQRGANTLLWKDMTHWRADRNTVLVYLSPSLFLHFPTRLSAEGFPIDELKASLERELGPARR